MPFSALLIIRRSEDRTNYCTNKVTIIHLTTLFAVSSGHWHQVLTKMPFEGPVRSEKWAKCHPKGLKLMLVHTRWHASNNTQDQLSGFPPPCKPSCLSVKYIFYSIALNIVPPDQFNCAHSHTYTHTLSPSRSYVGRSRRVSLER